MAEKEDHSKIMLELTQEFSNESDRAVALIAAAYLDKLLKELITNILVVKSKKNLERLFDYPAPLSSFSGRILVAFSLGLITVEQKTDLDHIRGARNRFAHELHGLTFDTTEVVEYCNNLLGARIDGMPATNREKFIKASVRLMVDLIIEIKKGSQTS